MRRGLLLLPPPVLVAAAVAVEAGAEVEVEMGDRGGCRM
jgi:hypothetical protein